MPPLSALTATVKCNVERLFFSKKRKVGAWVLRGAVEIGKTSVPFDMAVIAKDGTVGLYSLTTEPGK